MRWFKLLGAAAMAGGLALAEDPVRLAGPPVLQNSERPDDVVVRLPGALAPVAAAPAVAARPAPVAAVTAPPALPAPKPAVPVARPVAVPPIATPPIATPPVAATTPMVASVSAPQPPKPKPFDKPLEDPPPVLRKAAKPYYPPDFERDSALYCQRLIAQWTHPDAYNLFGDALRERPAMEDDDTENGRIYAFSDPTGRYREIELDFEAGTGLLRTVFVYPWTMTWKDCLRQWGAKVNSTGVSQGRVFYSYMNRRLDVLVDSTGKVISFGLY